MKINRCIKKSFEVIGKEGSTDLGSDFVLKLWEDANTHFNEIAHLAKKDEEDNILGVWGAMTDFTRSFRPWQDHFTKGLYLAGVEVVDGAPVPTGWVKWKVPSYEYLYVKCDEPEVFSKMISYMAENKIELVGAVHDYNCPKENGQAYMFFPIKNL